MNCHLHPQVAAVAACAQGCGRSLCVDCTQVHEPPTCGVCAQKIVAAHTQQVAVAKSELIKRIVINALFFIPYLLCLIAVLTHRDLPLWTIIPMAIWGFIGFRWLMSAFFSLTGIALFATLGRIGKLYVFGSLLCSAGGFVILPIQLAAQAIQLSRMNKE